MTDKDKALKAIDDSGVRAGQSWRHYKGGRYMVIAVGLEEATLIPLVIYAGHDGVVWARRLVVFLENVDASVPRFTQVDDDNGSTKPFERTGELEVESVDKMTCSEPGVVHVEGLDGTYRMQGGAM
jgi:hypothetical protein